MSAKRIVILAKKSDSTRLIYNHLSEDFEIDKVILEEPVSRKIFLKRRAKKLGYWTVFGQLLFQVFVVKFLKVISKSRVGSIQKDFAVQNTPIPKEKIINVKSVNSEEARKYIRELNPNLIIVNGTRIISKKTIGCSEALLVNTHVGITPAYRGVHGGYWALANDDRANCGVTVHLIDTGIDTGGILAQGLINPIKEDNFTTYPFLQTMVGVKLLKELIPSLLNKKINLKESLSASQSSLWSHPTIFQYFKNLITKGVK